MIAKVSDRGSRMRGVLEYLFGPGRADEHRSQRIVAAWDDVWVGVVKPDGIQRALLAAELDAPWRLMHDHKRPHKYVYHVSMSSHADDRDLSDVEWHRVAQRMIQRLSLQDCRWVAVHHGKASGGQDHIHVVVDLIRENGSKVKFPFQDYRVASHTARELTSELGLPVRTREIGAGQPALSRREITLQRATGSEPARERLRRGVRAAATAARTESEWLDELRRLGIVVRPRWERGGRTRVIGYSVALPSRTQPDGSRPPLMWYGGGRLARDLTLPALRAGWHPDPSATQAWRALDRAPETRGCVDPTALLRAAHEITTARHRLSSVPLDHDREWCAVAREMAGVLATIAERNHGAVQQALARASHQLSRAAQLQRRDPHLGRPADGQRMADVARAVLLVSLVQRGGPTAMVTLLEQVMLLVDTIRRTHLANGRAAQARMATQCLVETRTAARRTRAAATTHAPSSPAVGSPTNRPAWTTRPRHLHRRPPTPHHKGHGR